MSVKQSTEQVTGELWRLSELVACILEFEGLIEVSQQDCKVVAHSFERTDRLFPAWELAVKAASELCPWLNNKPHGNGDWSMNLFTIEGLWEFPA